MYEDDKHKKRKRFTFVIFYFDMNEMKESGTGISKASLVLLSGWFFVFSDLVTFHEIIYKILI